MIKAVFFDFDGVLTTDATGSESICNYIAEATGIQRQVFWKEYSKYNYGLLYGETTHESIWDRLNEDLGTAIDIKHMYDSFINTPIDSKMLNLAKKLHDRGYITGIITDNKSDRIAHIARHCNFDDVFDCIAVSADMGSGKQEQIIFEYVTTKTNCKPRECVFIDNSKKNLVVPEGMGMETIFYDYEKRDFEGLTGRLAELGLE